MAGRRGFFPRTSAGDLRLIGSRVGMSSPCEQSPKGGWKARPGEGDPRLREAGSKLSSSCELWGPEFKPQLLTMSLGSHSWGRPRCASASSSQMGT